LVAMLEVCDEGSQGREIGWRHPGGERHRFHAIARALVRRLGRCLILESGCPRTGKAGGYSWLGWLPPAAPGPPRSSASERSGPKPSRSSGAPNTWDPLEGSSRLANLFDERSIVP
jgi:hypothetical protein